MIEIKGPMDFESVNAVLSNELACVTRADEGKCDRHCENCDLLMDTEEIKTAYSIAIALGKTMIELRDSGMLSMKENMGGET